ncbi:MAG: beta-galactosidase [Dysgonamonadaceae bacterium]|jgi:beta-galactosidase/beta-glucuronidase|nr:beta-galactosidase [Dysgonamonadaceae bacterium]
MKLQVLLITALFVQSIANAQWSPAGDKIKTDWAAQVDPQNPLPEYPRPILQRDRWKNLNGLWQYAIRPQGNNEPVTFDGDILVPFAVESALSGVGRTVGQDNELWYRRTFSVPKEWKNQLVMLHFGAVDWKTEVFLNDVKIGEHKGGYTPFRLNITPFLVQGEQKLVVKVWDPTDKGFQPRGKQVSSPNGIWYTAVTGIWQTVWLEPVPENHIISVKTVPDVDRSAFSVTVETAGKTHYEVAEIKLSDNGQIVATAKTVVSQTVRLHVPDPKLWSPDSPFLYDLEISLISNNRPVDKVRSYCALRKISCKRDNRGVVRLQLNNGDLFQFGPLDQGWFPDGLYTAPSDEALLFDIEKTKELGFNMIRKHVKVEPARWYYHCDRFGMLVWQDMPSGDRGLHWTTDRYSQTDHSERTEQSERNFYEEWKEILDLLYSNPSVVVWVPFNEAWGQFKTAEVTEWTKNYDPSRLVNPASGGNHHRTGDILDIHHYPYPKLFFYDAQRPTVLGEYGGIGLPVEGSLWQTDRNWGYVKFKDSKEVTDEYVKYAEQLKPLIRSGFSAAVYTQTTDVEGEVNGLFTYDRKILKLDAERLRKVNREICGMLE